MKTFVFQILLKNINFDIFKNDLTHFSYSFREKFLRSRLCGWLFSREILTLKYFVNLAPYSSNSGCFGGIDFVMPISNEGYSIRGWVFSPGLNIEKLFLKVNQTRVPVYVKNLSRKDVFEKFPFIVNSANCGFVCFLRNIGSVDEHNSFYIEVHGENNIVRHGSF